MTVTPAGCLHKFLLHRTNQLFVYKPGNRNLIHSQSSQSQNFLKLKHFFPLEVYQISKNRLQTVTRIHVQPFKNQKEYRELLILNESNMLNGRFSLNRFSQSLYKCIYIRETVIVSTNNQVII